MQLLKDYGLKDVDIDGCEVSEMWRRKLAALIVSYHDVFSKDKLDCGEVKDFVHRIHLYDERPFRLPYRRIPPAHYQKLREVLSEMEEKGIISKSVSEYASPFVMVWKKDGNLGFVPISAGSMLKPSKTPTLYHIKLTVLQP